MPPPASDRPYRLPDRSDGTVLNHPANVTVAYAGLAEVRGLPIATLISRIEENFQRFFSEPTGP